MRGSRPRIVLDETHEFPRWKRFLKRFHDGHGKALEVIVAGSGRLDLFRRGGDSLFGRHSLFSLHPFMLGEMLAEDRDPVRAPADSRKALMSGGAHAQARSLLHDLETLAARDVEPSLLCFAERLKPRCAVQLVRNPEGFRTLARSSGGILTPATEVLALV